MAVFRQCGWRRDRFCFPLTLSLYLGVQNISINYFPPTEGSSFHSFLSVRFFISLQGKLSTVSLSSHQVFRMIEKVQIREKKN